MPIVAPSANQSAIKSADFGHTYRLLSTQSKADELIDALYPGYVLTNFYRCSTEKGLELHLFISPREAPICPECGEPAYVKERRTRFIQDMPISGSDHTIVHVDVRRVRCACGCTSQEKLPFIAGPFKHITARLAACVQSALRSDMTVASVSKKYDLHWQAVKDLDKEQLSMFFTDVPVKGIKRIAIDEFSLHKGHKYATCFMDLDTGKVFRVVKGKSTREIQHVFKELADAGVEPECVAVDMNAAFPNLVRKHFPKADIVYDLFHVVKHYVDDVLKAARAFVLHNAVETIKQEFKPINGRRMTDEARKARDKKISQAKKDLSRSEWLFVAENDALLPSRRKRLENLVEKNSLFATLHPIHQMLRNLWETEDHTEATQKLAGCVDILCSLEDTFGFKKAKKFAKLLENHADGIVCAGKHKVGTNRLEGANNKIKVAKRRAYGYKDFDYFALKIKAMLCGPVNPMDCLKGMVAIIDGKMRDAGIITAQPTDEIQAAIEAYHRKGKHTKPRVRGQKVAKPVAATAA